MRKLSLLALALAIVAVAGCGGGSGDDADSPLDNALRYLPADAPFAVAIATDGDQVDAAGDLSDRFPFGDQLRDQLEELVGGGAGDLERLEEIVGNELVVGSTDAGELIDGPSGEDAAFVGAIQAKSEGALDALVEGDRAEEDGEVDGATLYRDDSGDSFAIDGDVLVFAASKPELEAALATRDGDDSLTEAAFDAGTDGVSEDALARAYLNVGELLAASPDAKPALRSKWVAALRTAGVALTVEAGEIAIDVDLDTDPTGLTEADLPLAAGPAAPAVLDGDGEIELGLRDPAQLLAFAQATARAIDPEGFASFADGKAQLKRQLGVDLDADLIAQLGGDLAVSVGLDGRFGARAELEDPAATRRALTALEGVLGDIAGGVAAGERVELAAPQAGENLYTVTTGDGDRIVFGVVGDVLVVSDDPATAASLAEAPTAEIPGAGGALTLSADAGQLVRAALRQAAGRGFDLGDRIAGAISTRPLGDLLGSLEVTTEGLSGSFTLTTDD